VKSSPKENGQEKKKKKEVQWSTAKREMDCMNTFDVKRKNTAHPVDRMANWCIGGFWFTLAPGEDCTKLVRNFYSKYTNKAKFSRLELGRCMVWHTPKMWAPTGSTNLCVYKISKALNSLVTGQNCGDGVGSILISLAVQL